MSTKYNHKDIFDEDTKSEIGLRLKEFAQSNYGGVTKFAEELGIKQSQISKYTSGSAMPGAKILYQLALRGLDINYLFFGKSNGDQIAKLFEKYGIKNLQQLEGVLKNIKEIRELE